jgi:hypothetical protein
MKTLLIVIGLILLTSSAGAIGFYIGSKWRQYQGFRSNVNLGVSTTAKLDGEHLDRIYRDQDAFIAAGFFGSQTIPIWLIKLFTNDTAPEKMIEQTVSGIEESFMRQGFEISRDEIEAVVRERLAYRNTR